MNFPISDFQRACLIGTTLETLMELAASGCEKIRARVGENDSTPEALLDLLMQDSSPEVRISVALNARAPHAVLMQLAADASPDVRFAIAENPHTSIEILISLTADENPYVALRAEQTIEAIVSDCYEHKGVDMSARTIKRTMRRMLSTKERLNKSDALRLKELILADGYLSRGEKKIIAQAIENDLLDDQAFQIFRDILLQRFTSANNRRAIA